jgi:hypothetical protein
MTGVVVVVVAVVAVVVVGEAPRRARMTGVLVLVMVMVLATTVTTSMERRRIQTLQEEEEEEEETNDVLETGSVRRVAKLCLLPNQHASAVGLRSPVKRPKSLIVLRAWLVGSLERVGHLSTACVSRVGHKSTLTKTKEEEMWLRSPLREMPMLSKRAFAWWSRSFLTLVTVRVTIEEEEEEEEAVAANAVTLLVLQQKG